MLGKPMKRSALDTSDRLSNVAKGTGTVGIFAAWAMVIGLGAGVVILFLSFGERILDVIDDF